MVTDATEFKELAACLLKSVRYFHEKNHYLFSKVKGGDEEVF